MLENRRNIGKQAKTNGVKKCWKIEKMLENRRNVGKQAKICSAKNVGKQAKIFSAEKCWKIGVSWKIGEMFENR